MPELTVALVEVRLYQDTPFYCFCCCFSSFCFTVGLCSWPARHIAIHPAPLKGASPPHFGGTSDARRPQGQRRRPTWGVRTPSSRKDPASGVEKTKAPFEGFGERLAYGDTGHVRQSSARTRSLDDARNRVMLPTRCTRAAARMRRTHEPPRSDGLRRAALSTSSCGTIDMTLHRALYCMGEPLLT